MDRLMYSFAVLSVPVVCVCGVYSGASINYKKQKYSSKLSKT